MSILAIDPGSEKSAYVVITSGTPTGWGWEDNYRLLQALKPYSGEWESHYPITHLAMEGLFLRGMKVFQQAITTVQWTGRFIQAWEGLDSSGDFRVTTENSIRKEAHTLIDRKDVKMSLCGNATANDTSIRHAIIDKFGGPDVAVGGRKCGTCKGKGWRGRQHYSCPDCHCWSQSDDNPGEPDYDVGCGLIMHKGPLHGIKGQAGGHIYSAIGVGLTYLAQQEAQS